MIDPSSTQNTATQDTPQKLLTIKEVSSLQFSDEELFRKSFSKDTKQYAHSFLYLLRAAHGESGTLGFKYVSNSLIAVIGYRRNVIYITPVIDKTAGKELQKLCHEIAGLTGCHIYLKKFSQETYPYMKAIFRKQLLDSELEDDTCPETILKLPKLFITPEGAINPNASRFKKMVKRFEKFEIQIETIDDVTQVPQPKIESFLKMTVEKYANYWPMVTYLYQHGKDARYKTTVFLNKGTIEGLYIAEAFSQKEAGLYCAVNAKDKPGSTEWMDWYFFRKLFLEGIQTLYFGGAETKGVEYYIKKLLPDKPNYFVSTVEYKNNS